MTRPTTRRRGAYLATAAMASLAPLVLAVPAQAAPPLTPGAVPGAWIVTLDAGESPDQVATDHARRHGAQVDHVYRNALRGYAARMSEQAAERVARDPRVASIERDQVVTVAAPPGKGSTTAAAQTLPTGVDRIDGELSGSVAGNGSGVVDVDVAVLDTGIAAHPDLTIAGGRNCTSGNRNAYGDRYGHGTHVAGTVAAKDDGAGVVGVAPGARLWAVKVLNDQGSGTRSGIICGIDWITGRGGIEVANMSLGGSGTDSACGAGDAYHNAICNSVGAGTTYVVAAGNSAADAATSVPAAYDEVITVSALADGDGKPGELVDPRCRADKDDTFADFSNYGADVDLIAPGVCIQSTWPGGGYNTISGTSMAAPHVAGAAALYKAGHPAASPADVKAALQATATTDWNNVDDKDTTKEPLLNVTGF